MTSSSPQNLYGQRDETQHESCWMKTMFGHAAAPRLLLRMPCDRQRGVQLHTGKVDSCLTSQHPAARATQTYEQDGRRLNSFGALEP
jgi:hypothetical protein